MGSSISQVAPSTQTQGKGFAAPQSSQLGRSDGLDQNAINADPEGFKQWQQAQQPQTQQINRGKGGSVTMPSQNQQPRMGMPNNYPNTVGQWDNAIIQPQQSQSRGGKGKG